MIYYVVGHPFGPVYLSGTGAAVSDRRDARMFVSRAQAERALRRITRSMNLHERVVAALTCREFPLDTGIIEVSTDDR